jgi:hypothetical protein
LPLSDRASETIERLETIRRPGLQSGAHLAFERFERNEVIERLERTDPHNERSEVIERYLDWMPFSTISPTPNSRSNT